MKKIAFFGGSFDPVHNGHIQIAHAISEQFALDQFVFIPAFHAPHKLRTKPTSAYDRYAMLCLATQANSRFRVTKMELELPERPYSVETLARINEELPNEEIYFVMGGDSWRDITNWRQWETVLSLSNHIVVTRPGAEISFSHVTDEVRNRLTDLRCTGNKHQTPNDGEHRIYVTDKVNMDVSASEIRRKIRSSDRSWITDVPVEVANYIEKYQIYN